MVTPIADRVYGTVSAARQKEMNGLEFVQGLADRTLPLNTIARTLGYDVIEAATETEEIRAEGVVLSRGRRIGTAEGKITDRNGHLLAHGTTTYLIFEN
jgi:hypothetical protein